MNIRINEKTLTWVVIAALIGAVIYLQWGRISAYVGTVFASSQSTEQSSEKRFVVIDVTRILNAQRRIAAQLSMPGGSSGSSGTSDSNRDELASTLSRSGHMTNQVIRQVAGPNTVVLVKQAVVSWPGGKMPDITNKVLDQLGLPKNVPSAAGALPSNSDLPSALTTDPEMKRAQDNQQKMLDKRFYPKTQSAKSVLP